MRRLQLHSNLPVAPAWKGMRGHALKFLSTAPRLFLKGGPHSLPLIYNPRVFLNYQGLRHYSRWGPVHLPNPPQSDDCGSKDNLQWRSYKSSTYSKWYDIRKASRWRLRWSISSSPGPQTRKFYYNGKFQVKNWCDGKLIVRYNAKLRKMSKQYDFKQYLDHPLCGRVVRGLASEAMRKYWLERT